MDSAAISDYNYSNCSTDYESLLNNCSSSTSTSPSPCGGTNERCTEKRVKSNTVMNKIRRFARSQSQIRHGSRGANDYINSDNNLVSKTKDLYRDVKRRFSSFNANSLDSNDGQSITTANKSSLPTTRTSTNIKSAYESHPIKPTTLTCETLQSSAVSRLRRYASDESLPTSESGCGSSVKTSSLSTDSNRSSICTVNDFASEYSVFKGPFIGQGIALTDCTPCPYDKDALVFKKGDLVNIIAKNDSGTWIGMANGKIGHFKFINVEEISSLGNGMRSNCSSFCSASSTTLTSTNGVIESGRVGGGPDESSDGLISNTHHHLNPDNLSCLAYTTSSTSSSPVSTSAFTNLNSSSSSNCSTNSSIAANPSGFVVSHYEDIIRNLLSSVNIYLDNSLKGLFKLIGLDSYDYLTKLKDKGFTSLGSLMNITDPSVLEIVGITCPEHQQTILSIATIVRKLAHSMPNESMMIKSSGCTNLTSSGSNNNKSSVITINKLASDFSILSVNGQSGDSSNQPITQSVPSTPAFDSFQKSLSFNSTSSSSSTTTTTSSSSSSNVQIKHQPSPSSQDAANCNESTTPTTTINTKSGLLKADSKSNFSTTICVSSATVGDQLTIGSTGSALRLRKKRDRRSSETCDNIKRAASGSDILDDDLYSKYKYSSYDHRKSLDTNALVKKLEHGYETTSRTVRGGYGDIGPTKRLSSSKSVFDLKFNSDSTSNLIDTESIVHGSIHCTKKRLKKFLNQSDHQSSSQQHRNKTISTTIPTNSTTTSSSSSTFDQNQTNQSDSGRLGITSRPLSSALFEALSNILSDENIDLTVEPYSDNSGFCGIPPALVQRYAEELETDVYDIAETLDYIRLCSLLNKAGRQGIPNDFLADSCNGPGTDWANYENLHSWLLSLGLPMYEIKLKDSGHKNLRDIIQLREDDLLNCGIINKRHLRSLTTAISALSVNQHKIGRS